MHWWQIVACVFTIFWLISLLGQGPFAWRLMKLRWFHGVSESVLFPAGVVTASGITAEVRPVTAYLFAIRLVVIVFVFLVFAAMGFPGKIGFGLSAAALGKWGVPVASVVSLVLMLITHGLASATRPHISQHESAMKVFRNR